LKVFQNKRGTKYTSKEGTITTQKYTYVYCP